MKTVLVTGSSRGIGKGIALAFGKAGYRVILNASKSVQELEQTKKELEQQQIAVCAYVADVSDYTACQNMFLEIKQQYGMIDVLVNNAGISQIGLFTDFTPEQHQRLMQINFGSVVNCTYAVVPDMVRKQSGTIINISSIWGNVGASCEAVYAASKGAINAFTKSMAKELGPSNIRVNALACGVIDTKMNDCFSPEEKQLLSDEIALMRFGTVEEVAAMAVFLASTQCSFVTGQVITIDGGML